MTPLYDSSRIKCSLNEYADEHILWKTRFRGTSVIRIVDGPDGYSLQWQLKPAQPPILPAAFESTILPNQADTRDLPSNPPTTSKNGIEIPAFQSFFRAAMP